MNTGLKNASVLITGGGTGIGLAVAKVFLEEGANVTVLQRSEKGIQNLKDEVGENAIEIVKGDVTNYEDNEKAVKAAVTRFGKLDVFIGNAGIYDFSEKFLKQEPQYLIDQFEKIMKINVLGYILGAKAAVEELQKTKGSIILNLSSSSFYAGGGGVNYVASKHAGVGLVKQLAFELAPDIRVNAVAPGGTITPLGGTKDDKGNTKRLSDFDGFGDMVARNVPLGFAALPEDQAGLFVFLASKKLSRFMTAEIIKCDGGIGIRKGKSKPKTTV